MQFVAKGPGMVLGIRAWLRSIFGGEDAERDDEAAASRGGSEAPTDESESGGFAPSVLDASVRYAHGDTGPDLEGELASLEEEAERLDAERKD